MDKIYHHYTLWEDWKAGFYNNMSGDAYLGQAACCIYGSVPSTITMEAWSLLDNKTKERSNNIALNIIKKWKLANKNIQLCLKII